ncbi:MAG: ribosomal protein L7/L12 [Cyanobacteria bacterium J06635_15]
MRIVKQISAAVLLVIGFWCLARAVETGLDNNPSRLDKRETVTAGILLGIPAAGFGGWLGLDTHLQRKREERERLQGIFFQLVKAGKGYIAPIRFSMETGLTGEAAIDYLNQRARVYNADFQVDDTGGITYYFNLGKVNTQLLNPSPEQYFDVVLEAVPVYKRREVVKVVQHITGLGWKEVKTLVKTVPQPVQRNASQKVAEDYKRQLESVGAQVALVLRS